MLKEWKPVAPRSTAAAGRTLRGHNLKRIASLVLAAGGALLWGCEADSFIDPSVVGRWEHTPTIVPVLDRLASVEGVSGDGVDMSQIRSEDLIPDIEAYRLGAGDGIVIEINDLFVEGKPERFEREIDSRGVIDLPLAKIPLNLDNLTPEQAQARISQALRDAQVLSNAVVSLQVAQRRRATFHMIGGVSNPGLYQIPKPEYRILEALSQVGRFSEQVQSVFVIRQIPLSDSVTGRGRGEATVSPGAAPFGGAAPTGGAPAPAPGGKPGGQMLDLIDELTKPAGTPPPASAPAAAPAGTPKPAAAPGTAPKIDLIDDKPATKPNGSPSVMFGGPDTLGRTNWHFDGSQWSNTGQINASMQIGGQGTGVSPGGDLVTQRVIEVPLAPLLSGSARYNIVIRPGDIVRVPSPSEGLVYIGGQVSRPGVFTLPAVGKLTLYRAVTSAGGLGSTAIPERVEIIRMLGPDRQAIVRVNLRAIAEGTQPDIILKSDDMVNIGTNFWALPLAVIRNGFRASYGYGFILDRNFGFDVFGPQQTNGL